MNEDLINELWARALCEGEGVRGVGQRMAQLVAEECAKLCDQQARVYEAKRDAALDNDVLWERRHSQLEAVEWVAGGMRAAFGLDEQTAAVQTAQAD